jgi:tetratricopeptide (TPR) repeat protein
MKQITGIFFAASVLLACNNKSTEPVTSEAVPVQEKEMKDAIAKYPDSVLLKQNLIQYYQDNGSIEMALAETDKALAKDSGDASFWDKKAELYALNDDTANAITAYEHAIAVYPDPQYVMSLGWLYAKTKNSKALEMADALLEASKAHAEKEGMLIKGLYYAATGDSKQALTYFDNALSMDYNFMFAYREKAIVLFDMGKYDDAITVLTKAVTLQNKFDEGYYWMGKCYEKKNDIESAIKNYKVALLFNPGYIEASDALGKLGVK